jgi:glycosyltransferase involved in cell wall biosynthesis
MPKNLLIITQRVDDGDDLLGFFVDWIKEFSKHFDTVNVITLAMGHYDLPPNVSIHSLGKERHSSKIMRAIRFYKYLFQLVPGSSGIFAHMSPIFVVASWPVAFIHRKKIILWYLHRSVTLRLKIAEKLCYKIVTAARESLGVAGDKIVELGHGISVNKFRHRRMWEGKCNFKIVSVGRISLIKNFETIINAVALLRDKGHNFEVDIIGKPIMSKDFNYFESLKSLVSKLKLADAVKFIGFVPHGEIDRYYKNADIFVGPLPTGGLDKAVLEAMATGCISLTSNTAFNKYLGPYSEKLIFKYCDSVDLASKLENILNMSSDDRSDISGYLTDMVDEYHNVDSLIIKLSNLYE